MKNLFIDSNIWLSLYHFTNDDLMQFRKLKELNGKDIRLFIPRQVCDEVRRNREAKLKEAFKQFEIKAIQFPAFFKDYEEYEQFSKDYSDLLKRYKEWKRRIDADVRAQSLPADKIIGEFFESTELLECDSLVDKAFTRYRIGNPPGKDNKYGDAINWECLLSVVPDGEDLYIISSDKDYRSELFDDMMSPFLVEEWQQKKHSHIFFYKNLVPFLNEHFKNIQLKSEQEKQELISKLNQSCNFVSTHGIIAMMSKYDGWTESQIEDICLAAETNTQVNWIFSDTDIFNFYSHLLSKVNYGSLDDCATKRVIDMVMDVRCLTELQEEMEARETYEAEVAEATEEYYRH